MVLVVNDKQPYKNLKELVDDAKKRPNGIVFSSSGLYGALHLPTALFMKAAGIQMRHLPTNGGGPAVNAPGKISRLAWHDPASLPEPLTATTRIAIADAGAGHSGVIRQIKRDVLREVEREAVDA